MKDKLIEFELDEMVECEVEALKIKNLLLLENLLKEVSNQIVSKNHNLNKIKEIVNER